MSGSTGSAYNKDYYKTRRNDEDDDMIDKISDYKGNHDNIRYVGWLFGLSAFLGLYISIQYFIIFFEEKFYLNKKEENRDIPKGSVDDMKDIIKNLNNLAYYYSNITLVITLSVCLIFFIAGNSVWWMNGGISDALKSERKMAQNLSMVVAAPERLQSAAGLLSSYIYPGGDKNGSQQEKEDYYGQQALGKQLEQSIRNEFYDKNAKTDYEPIYDDYDPQKEAEARAYERTEQAFAPQEGAPETYGQWAERNKLLQAAKNSLDPRIERVTEAEAEARKSGERNRLIQESQAQNEQDQEVINDHKRENAMEDQRRQNYELSAAHHEMVYRHPSTTPADREASMKAFQEAKFKSAESEQNKIARQRQIHNIEAGIDNRTTQVAEARAEEQAAQRARAARP